MLDFLSSLTMEQQAMLTGIITFGIVWLIKRAKFEWEQDDLDKMRYYVHAVVWSMLVAAIQNAGDWNWHKWFAAAIVGFLASQGIYTTHKTAKRLIERENG